MVVPKPGEGFCRQFVEPLARRHFVLYNLSSSSRHTTARNLFNDVIHKPATTFNTMMMFGPSFRAIRTYPRLTYFRVAQTAKLCVGSHHFLEQKPGHNNYRYQSNKAHPRGGAEGGTEEGEKGLSWRDLVGYGLQGLAVFLLAHATWSEIVVPWYSAYQRDKRIRVLVEEIGVEVVKKDEGQTAKPFSSAKCATRADSENGVRRSQQYNFLAEAVERAAPSVVFIEKAQSVNSVFGAVPISVSTGSGFIVSEDGYVVTNAHVVGSARSVKVKLSSGEIVNGEVTDLDQVSDLALLKLNVNKKLPALEFGSSSSLRPGEWVVALGSPLSLSNTITAGIVSSCHRPSKELGLHHNGLDMQYVQTDATITVGNSGGPLVNLDGEVIGVNTLTAGPGISFAIPSDFAKDFVARANKTARKPGKFAIGISMLTVTPDLHFALQQRGLISSELENGVFVAQVWPSSVAAQAGLKKGDVIVRINGKDIASSSQVYSMVQSGQRLHLEIIRNSERRTVTLVPEKM